MIEITSGQLICSWIVETDKYVPLTFRNLDEEHVVPLYWVCSCEDTQLIEVGVSPETGCIIRLVLTLLHTVRVGQNVSQSNFSQIISEIPICRLDPWAARSHLKDWHQANFVHEENLIETLVYEDSLEVHFTKAREFEVGYRCGEILFGQNASGHLSCIQYKPKRREDWQNLLYVLS